MSNNENKADANNEKLSKSEAEVLIKAIADVERNEADVQEVVQQIVTENNSTTS